MSTSPVINTVEQRAKVFAQWQREAPEIADALVEAFQRGLVVLHEDGMIELVEHHQQHCLNEG